MSFDGPPMNPQRLSTESTGGSVQSRPERKSVKYSTETKILYHSTRKSVPSVTDSDIESDCDSLYSRTTGSLVARHSHYKEGIRLAEMGDWDTLVKKLANEPQLARHKDHHGMLPLHWACTEETIPLVAVQSLLQAYPEGVMARNSAGYLPVHIAIRASSSFDIIKLLCDTRPSTLLEVSPTGKTLLVLAIEANLSRISIDFLQKSVEAYENELYEHAENTKQVSGFQSDVSRNSIYSTLERSSTNFTGNNVRGVPNISHIAKSKRRPQLSFINQYQQFGETSYSKSTAMIDETNEDYEHPQTSQWPPILQHSAQSPHLEFQDQYIGGCGMCYKKFSVFRKKYQCESCGIYLCRKHVAAKVELPNHIKKRNVCSKCFLVNTHGRNVSGEFPYVHSAGMHQSNVVDIESRPRMTDTFYRDTVLSTSTSSTAQTGLLKRTSSPVRDSGTERRGHGTLTQACTDVVALHERIAALEEQNMLLLSGIARQEKQYKGAMVLLKKMMKRVAEIELHMPSTSPDHQRTTGGFESDTSDVNPFEFGDGLPREIG